MNTKTGRNDPCPCGSGKKYKQCCMSKAKSTAGISGLKKKFTAKLLSQPKPIDLMERTFGSAIETIEKEQHVPESEPGITSSNEQPQSE
jgi:SEC-C motif-containing protein